MEEHTRCTAPAPRTFVTVPGVAIIQAGPYRSWEDAQAFARRIACNTAAYLSVIADYGVPGITDIRPDATRQGSAPAADVPVSHATMERGAA